MVKLKYFLAGFFAVVLLTGCSVSYTLSGASIPETAKTFSVAYFPNQAAYVNPLLSQVFTEYMKEFFSRRTRLQLIERNGDFHFEGEITSYDIRPMAIQADAASAETRLTIKINVRCFNAKDPDKDFENTFSAFSDFESSESLQSVEGELVEDIINQITENVFNQAFTDW